MKKTIFCDIDGCIFKQKDTLTEQFKDLELLPGVIEKFNKWDAAGYNIILTSGRKESMRKLTEKQLLKHGVFFDQLILGLGSGVRIIINDKKIDSENDTAIAINIERNKGLTTINIE